MRLAGLFDAEIETAHILARRRIELLPELARQSNEFVPAKFTERFVALASLLPELGENTEVPLIRYLVYRVFLCAAQGTPDLREAAAALYDACALNQGLDATPAWYDDDAKIDVLWTVPQLVPGLNGVPVGLPPSAERAGFLENVRSGLQLISKTCPGLAAKLKRELRWIVPMPEENAGRHSMTLANLHGTIFVGAKSDPDLMAELMVHEYLHMVLHAASEVVPLIEGESSGADLYSPWREDSRPPEGLVHGIYVFAGVQLLWLRFVEEQSRRGKYSRERVAMLRLQLPRAIRTIQERFSGVVVNRIIETAGRSLSLAQTAPIPQEVASIAGHCVDRHYRRWLVRHESGLTISESSS